MPCPNSFKVYTGSTSSISKVQDLILLSSGWNISLVDALILPVDSEIIKKIPLGQDDHADLLFWHYDKYVEFIVKPCYAMASNRLFN